MNRIFSKAISTIRNIFSDIRGEVKSPEEEKSEKQKLNFDRRRSLFKIDEVNIEGKSFCVCSIFDRESKQTAVDKIKYLIGSDTKN